MRKRRHEKLPFAEPLSPPLSHLIAIAFLDEMATTNPEKTPHDVATSPDNFDRTPSHIVNEDRLRRALSARQVQMIAIGGTIGTGLFLGTGKALATGGPASLLICYSIVGFIIFVTMLSLGEMAAFVPVAGSFCTFAGRYVDDAFGFALTVRAIQRQDAGESL
jgi:AAT family amino acid transporter